MKGICVWCDHYSLSGGDELVPVEPPCAHASPNRREVDASGLIGFVKDRVLPAAGRPATFALSDHPAVHFSQVARHPDECSIMLALDHHLHSYNEKLKRKKLLYIRPASLLLIYSFENMLRSMYESHEYICSTVV